MNRRCRLLLAISAACSAAALLFSCGSLQPFSGGGTEGGNTVSGVFVNDDGSALAMEKVLLVPSDYNPGAANHYNPIVTTTTADDGSYSFDHITQGNYSIEAAEPENNTRSLITGIAVNGKDFRAPFDTLRVPGAIKVFLPAIADAANGYVYVPGTTRYARLNGATRYAVMSDLPAKPLPSICYATSADPNPVVLRYNVGIVSGDTTVVANAGWNYSRRLYLNTTASGAGVSQNIAGFPVIVRLTKDNFNFAQANAGGTDIRFSRSDTIRLPYEIERWDPVAGLAEVWVRVDSIFGNDSTQFITMYWGNAHATDSSSGAAVFDTSNGFIGVWHMNENPSTGAVSIKDRTVNAHDATPFGSMTSANSIEGATGKALPETFQFPEIIRSDCGSCWTPSATTSGLSSKIQAIPCGTIRTQSASGWNT
jgi:hypothetical protein